VTKRSAKPGNKLPLSLIYPLQMPGISNNIIAQNFIQLCVVCHLVKSIAGSASDPGRGGSVPDLAIIDCPTKPDRVTTILIPQTRPYEPDVNDLSGGADLHMSG